MRGSCHTEKKNNNAQQPLPRINAPSTLGWFIQNVSSATKVNKFGVSLIAKRINYLFLYRSVIGKLNSNAKR